MPDRARFHLRREFLRSATGSLVASGLCLGANTARGASRSVVGADGRESDDSTSTMRPLDYGRSFICNTASFNAVRFWIESRTRVIDTRNGTVTDYYQCGSCKSEHTFAERNLFHEDNYDFLPILGGGQWLIFRRHAQVRDRYRSIVPETLWGQPVLKLVEMPRAARLDTWERIRDATAAAWPLVTQTELSNVETGLRAVIECPCKTMNISIDNRMYQVDTGPVAFPDLTRHYDPQIECLSLAYIAFNAPDFADFVIEQPTPVANADGSEIGHVYHYSQPFSLPTKNHVIAMENP
jgi:hypothetical protein